MPELRKQVPCSKVPADGTMCSTTFYNTNRTCPERTTKLCAKFDFGERACAGLAAAA